MTRTDVRSSLSFFLRSLAVLLACGVLTLVRADEPTPLGFLRVHVPPDRLSEIPLGSGRYVPMTLAEFRAALVDRTSPADVESSSLGSSPARTVIADEVSYRLIWNAVDGFRGTAEVTLGPDIVGLRRAIPLTGQAITQATYSSEAGTGAAEVCGLPDGTMAVIAEAEGTYAWQFALPTNPGGQLGPIFHLPLVPAVFTSVELLLPPGVVPVVNAAEAKRVPLPADVDLRPTLRDDDAVLVAWRLELGPTEQLDGSLAAQPLPEVPLSCWSRLTLQRRSSTLSTTLVPTVPWTTTTVRLRVDAGITVVAAHLDGMQTTNPLTQEQKRAEGVLLSWRMLPDDASQQTPDEPIVTTMLLQLPTRAIGTRQPLTLESIAAFETGFSFEGGTATESSTATRLPTIGPPEELWAGGGLVTHLDPRFVVTGVTPTGYLPVDDAVVDAWPNAMAATDVEGPTLAFEAQAANATLSISVAPRQPDVEVSRVTTVDISAGSVIGQTASDVTVTRGEIFELVGQVAAGWLIDSVEIPSRSEPPEWRVEPTARGSLLRIGLVNGVADGTTVQVNVMGHRGPLREGEPFARPSLEMLTLDDEQVAALEIRTNAEMTIDGAGGEVESVPLEKLPAGLRRLASDSGVRLRLLATSSAQDQRLRLLRRRPPIDVQAQVRLTVRDDRLTESFTLECAPRDAEIDSVVVHFSEPTGDGMEWSLLPPTTGQLLARRLQPQEPRDPTRGMESWLLELVPPARGAVTLRGVQTVPFDGPANVPLTWVEGAASPVGELQIRDAGRQRPLVVNRTLSEIPGVAGDTERYATSVSRFLFDPRRDLAGGLAAARIVPGGDDGVAPRAWAWNETTTCWCHTSGVVEYETVFDIENHGRSQVVLSHPPDKQIQEILVDGTQLVAGVRQTLGGETVIELPAGRRMVRLEIHALASARPLIPGWQHAWTVDPVAGVIDLPVLERLWQVGIPPGLRIAHVPSAHHRLEATQVGWAERLLASTIRRADATPGVAARRPSEAALVGGFRLHAFAPTSGRSTSVGMLLVSRQVVVSAGIVIALVAGLATWFFSRRAPAVAVALCGITAVLALWVPPNALEVARAAWWGGTTGLVLTMLGGRKTGPLCVLLLACVAGESIAAEPAVGEPLLKVFVTGDTEESTVLVPDRLFRELGRGVDAVESLGVRVERVTVVAAVPAADPSVAAEQDSEWLLTIDLSSDSNTVCTLRQPASGGQFVAGSLQLDGSDAGDLLNESISADGRILRVPLAAPGRHRLSVRVRPQVISAGSVGTATIGLPVAPQAGLRIAETAEDIDVASLLVERERNGLPVVETNEATAELPGGLLDIARSDLLRLCWSLEAGGKLTAEPRVLAARNDITWETERCRVVASFQFDPGDAVFRSFVMSADPRLEPANEALSEEAESVTIRRIGDGAWLVERLQPLRGPTTVSVPFVMPLADPVGVFRVPEVRIVTPNTASATRLVQFIPEGSYDATVRLPTGVTAVTPSEAVSDSGWLAWRREPSRLAEEPEPVSIAVTRTATALRGTQRMRLDTEGDRLRLRFDASIDSVDAALGAFRVSLPPTWEIQRVGLARVTTPRSGALQATPQDIHWGRAADGSVQIIPQHPRAGRFRFDLEASEPSMTSGEGDLVIPGIIGLGDIPVIVEWPTDGGLQVATGAGGVALSASEWQSLEQLPAATLRYSRVPSAAERAAIAAATAAGETSSEGGPGSELNSAIAESGDGSPRVEQLEVRFATDERGKAWGVARIDLVPAQRLVRLQLPPGMRLFEVFVDEHPLRARPVGDAAWELELLDVSRPRTIQVIFAGDIRESLVSGVPLKLEPPKLPGIETREVLWMIRGPRGLDLRLLTPSVQLTPDGFESRREQASARLQAALRRALEGRDTQERRRIEEQVSSIFERTELSTAEVAWNRTSLALSEDVFATTSDPSGGIILRAAATPTPTDSSRAVATAVAILIAGATWSLSVRSPLRMTSLLIQFGPLLAMVTGVAWAVQLSPAWPGLLLTGGAMSVVVRRLLPLLQGPLEARGGLVIRDSVRHRVD